MERNLLSVMRWENRKKFFWPFLLPSVVDSRYILKMSIPPKCLKFLYKCLNLASKLLLTVDIYSRWVYPPKCLNTLQKCWNWRIKMIRDGLQTIKLLFKFWTMFFLLRWFKFKWCGKNFILQSIQVLER